MNHYRNWNNPVAQIVRIESNIARQYHRLIDANNFNSCVEPRYNHSYNYNRPYVADRPYWNQGCYGNGNRNNAGWYAAAGLIGLVGLLSSKTHNNSNCNYSTTLIKRFGDRDLSFNQTNGSFTIYNPYKNRITFNSQSLSDAQRAEIKARGFLTLSIDKDPNNTIQVYMNADLSKVDNVKMQNRFETSYVSNIAGTQAGGLIQQNQNNQVAHTNEDSNTV